MPVIYNSKKIIPAPFIRYTRVPVVNDDGTRIGSTFNITVEGKLTVDKGSPNSAGTFWTVSGYPPDETIPVDSWLTTMLRKQEALRSLFSEDGKSFEVQGYDGMQPMKCNPRIKNIDFNRGNVTSWTNLCDYTINLEADIIYVNGTALGEDTGDLVNYHVDKFDESWAVESADDIGRTFRLTHQLSAKGKRFFDDTGTLVYEAWQNAQNYLLNKIQLGIDSAKMIAAGVLDNTTLQAYNYMRSQNINEAGGTCSISETWLCFDPGAGAHAVEDFTVNTRSGNEGLTTVSIEGTIKGLEIRNNTTRTLISTRWTNAQAKFAEVLSLLPSRAQTISGYNLNPIALNRTIGRNEINGTINYNYEYNNRPSTALAGAISESITFNYENQADVFATIPVLGRALGPVLQPISTYTAKKFSINYEAVVQASTQDAVATKPNTDAIINTYLPAFSNLRFKDRDIESWSPSTGRISRQVSFTYE